MCTVAGLEKSDKLEGGVRVLQSTFANRRDEHCASLNGRWRTSACSSPPTFLLWTQTHNFTTLPTLSRCADPTSCALCCGDRKRADALRVTGVTRTGVTGVTEVTRVMEVTGVTAVTGVNGVTRVTKVTKVTRVNGDWTHSQLLE